MNWQRFLPNLHTLIVCVHVLQAVSSELYKKVTVDDCTQDSIHDARLLAAAGTLLVNLTQGQLVANPICTVTFSAPPGNRLSLSFPAEFQLPWQHAVNSVDGVRQSNCSGGYMELFDAVSGQHLAPGGRLCGRVSTRLWGPLFTSDTTFALKIVTGNGNFDGGLLIDADYTAFKNGSQDAARSQCHLCEHLTDETRAALCIDPGLRCDGVNNCPSGYTSDEDYRYTVDPVCRFRCGPPNSKLIDHRKVCDGRKDCSNGLDERKEMCEYGEDTGPFGPLSLADGVVTIICCVILVILFTVCLYCCCCPPPPEQKKMLYSSNINLNYHDCVTSSTADGPGRAQHTVNSRDHNDLRVSSL
ncbi:uncharacterized protein [Ptychodera flava]|uniref:uncharacterized protein isoform X2 n=1 Tax=Ptychodera flava TaxID=63121 RepID=UPI00396A0478